MLVEEMTRKELEALPHRKWNEDIGLIDSLIILPTRRKHDSGWRCMDFVAVRNHEPVCLLSGCSDVINIEGIGGLGNNWRQKYGGVPSVVPPREWSIDCLYKSGLLRLFTNGKIKVGIALSTFEIYSVSEESKQGNYLKARGCAPRKPGGPLAEDVVRRGRGG